MVIVTQLVTFQVRMTGVAESAMAVSYISKAYTLNTPVSRDKSTMQKWFSFSGEY